MQLDSEFVSTPIAPSTSGLARRRRRRGAQLDGEFAFYASRRRLRPGPGPERRRERSWTGYLLSTPPAADFGPCPEGAAEGGAAGLGVALYASSRRLRAWPGGGGGGERSRTGSLLSMPLAADFEPGPEGAAEGQPMRRACRPSGSGTEGAPTAVADRHPFRSTTGHTFVWFYICHGILLVSECAHCRLDDFLLPRRLWRAGRGVAGKRDTCCCVYHPPWQLLGWRLGWKDCCCGWLWMEHRRSTCCYASRRQCSPRLSPPTSGLARRRRQRGAQLDWEFGLYASRRPPAAGRLRAGTEAATKGCEAGRGVCLVRLSSPTTGLARRGRRRGAHTLLSWKGSLLSAPPAADFGPGPEAAAEGCAAGRGVCFLRLQPPTSGLAQRRRRRGFKFSDDSPLDGEFALYASRRQLRARPGGGGRGTCSSGWTGSLLSTPLAADFGPCPEAHPRLVGPGHHVGAYLGEGRG